MNILMFREQERAAGLDFFSQTAPWQARQEVRSAFIPLEEIKGGVLCSVALCRASLSFSHFIVQWFQLLFFLQVVSSASLSYFAVSRSFSCMFFSPLPSSFPFASLSSHGFMLLNPSKHRQSIWRAYIHLQGICRPEFCSHFIFKKHFIASEIHLLSRYSTSPSGDKLMSSTKYNTFLETLQQLTAEVGSLNHQFAHVGTQMQKWVGFGKSSSKWCRNWH